MQRYSYNRIKEMRKDETFWNSSQTGNYEYTVGKEPREVYSESLQKNQLMWTGINTSNGEEDNFLITEGLEHYGPSIYSYPAYVGVDEIKLGD